MKGYSLTGDFFSTHRVSVPPALRSGLARLDSQTRWDILYLNAIFNYEMLYKLRLRPG